VQHLFELYELGSATPTPRAAAPPAGFVPLASVRLAAPLVWHSLLREDELPRGVCRGLRVGEARVLVVRVDGELHAYRDACPGGPLPLHLGRLEGSVLICPWHGCRFDLRTGERLGGGLGLTRLPLTVENGAIHVGLRQGAPR
jgi:3-phenylpropionate/trans-cinnamate dioxygenase ferredoxin subunit